jgi:hypothetical protein
MGTYYYLNRISNILNLLIWFLVIIGNMMVTFFLNTGTPKEIESTDNIKLSFPSYVPAKRIELFLYFSIIVEVVAIIKLLFAIFNVIPIGCGSTEPKGTPSQRAIDISAKAKEKGRDISPEMVDLGLGFANKMIKYGKTAIFAFVIFLILFAFNLYLTIRLANLLRSSVEEDKRIVIILPKWEKDLLKGVMYISWFIIGLMAIFMTWVDLFCPNLY